VDGLTALTQFASFLDITLEHRSNALDISNYKLILVKKQGIK